MRPIIFNPDVPSSTVYLRPEMTGRVPVPVLPEKTDIVLKVQREMNLCSSNPGAQPGPAETLPEISH